MTDVLDETEAPEAEVAEPATGDHTEPDDVTEPEPEPDDGEPEGHADLDLSSQARMEEIGKKLDGLQKHVTKRLGEILGEDVLLFEECEVCSFSNTPGWRPKGPYPAEVVDAVRRAMGQHAPSDYKRDNYSHACDDCAGLGSTISGSQVANQETLTCFKCKGRGWTAVGPERGGMALAPPTGNGGEHVNKETGEITYEPVIAPDSPEIVALKAAGYVVIAPLGATS